MAEVKVIVHASSSITSISKGDLEKLYINKKQSLDQGKVDLITLKGGATLQEFLSTYVGKNEGQFNQIWKKAIFTGQGIAPKEVGSDAEMVQAVASNPKALGFVSADTDTSSVKVITVE